MLDPKATMLLNGRQGNNSYSVTCMPKLSLSQVTFNRKLIKHILDPDVQTLWCALVPPKIPLRCTDVHECIKRPSCWSVFRRIPNTPHPIKKTKRTDHRGTEILKSEKKKRSSDLIVATNTETDVSRTLHQRMALACPIWTQNRNRETN